MGATDTASGIKRVVIDDLIAPASPAIAPPGSPATRRERATRTGPLTSTGPPATTSTATSTSSITSTGASTSTGAAPPTGSGTRRWQILITVIGVLALLATCGLFSLLLVQDELAGREAARAEPDASGPPSRDISSRLVDPEPLSEQEVFPTSTIAINPDEDPYQVLGTQDSSDCTVAAADALAEVVAALDCSQVVRGTLRSPTGDYLITTGIFNLATAAEAEHAYDAVDPVIKAGTGRFVGMMAGEDTGAIMLSETRSGWDYRGHFLIYAVIARADSGAFALRDELNADLIFWDMIEVHIRSGVLEQRATTPSAGAEAREEP